MTRHFLSTKNLSRETIATLLERAKFFAQHHNNDFSKLFGNKKKTALFLFNEPSTRTYFSFAMAASHLGIDVIASPPFLSLEKGESFQDTITTMMAMKPDILIIRHHVSRWFRHDHISLEVPLINAGDGCGEHPTQAMIDVMAIASRHTSLKGLTIAICGDILHSRVANSHVHLLTTLGMTIRFVGPKKLNAPTMAKHYDIPHYHSMKQGLKDVDIVMMLRLQKERIEQNKDYQALKTLMHNDYQLTEEHLIGASPDVLILHPGPVQRGIDMSETLLSHAQKSLISTQLSCGIPMRMAILEFVLLANWELS